MKLCYLHRRLTFVLNDNDKNINIAPIYKYRLYKWLYKGHKICIRKANINHYQFSIKYNQIYMWRYQESNPK